jgi:RNA-directed DNA polymerase
VTLGDGPKPASVTVRAIVGFPARELIDASRGADMLVVGSRGVGGFTHYFRHGVSKDVFGHVDYLAWTRLAKWLRRKHSGLSWRQYRRRFCLPGTWKIAYGGAVFRGASSVGIIRYRYRGTNIPTPWTPRTAAVTG